MISPFSCPCIAGCASSHLDAALHAQSKSDDAITDENVAYGHATAQSSNTYIYNAAYYGLSTGPAQSADIQTSTNVAYGLSTAGGAAQSVEISTSDNIAYSIPNAAQSSSCYEYI